MNDKNMKLRLKLVLLLAVLPVCLVAKAQGASFDCSKATTKIEKMICADAGLSNLDEELTKAYLKAMEKAPDPVAFKLQQQGWLKERNVCPDAACLKDQYQLRIGELNRIISLVPLAEGQESHYFEKEADKLKVMQDIVRRQGQAFSFSPPYMKEPDYCSEFMKDFIAGRNFVAIEPDFQSNDKDDPRFARFNRCLENHPERPAGEGDFYVIGILGGPPYRYYHIDVDGNPETGKEDVVYSEWEDGRVGSTGYSWIDARECTVRGGTSMYMGAWQNVPRHLYRLNTIVLYKGIPMSLEIHPTYWDTEPAKYSFDAMRFMRDKGQVSCGWSPVSDNKK